MQYYFPSQRKLHANGNVATWMMLRAPPTTASLFFFFFFFFFSLGKAFSLGGCATVLPHTSSNFIFFLGTLLLFFFLNNKFKLDGEWVFDGQLQQVCRHYSTIALPHLLRTHPCHPPLDCTTAL